MRNLSRRGDWVGQENGTGTRSQGWGNDRDRNSLVVVGEKGSAEHTLLHLVGESSD